MDHPERECVTCGERGHWYTECPRLPFGSLVAAAFGVPIIAGPSEDELRVELAKLQAERVGMFKDEKSE